MKNSLHDLIKFCAIEKLISQELGLLGQLYESPVCQKDMKLVDCSGRSDNFQWKC